MEHYLILLIILLIIILVAVIAYYQKKINDKKNNKTEELDLSLYDNIKVPIYIINDENYEILYANKLTLESHGNIIGKKCYKELCSRETKCEFCKTGEELNKEKSYVHENGFNAKTNKYYRIYGEKFKWPNIKNTRICLAIDITKNMELYKQTEELSSMQNIHESILNSATMFFYVLDKDYKILYINEMFTNACGHDLKIGDVMPIGDIYSKYDTDRFYDLIFVEVINGKNRSGEVIMYGIDKNEIPIRYFSFPVKNKYGEVIGYGTIGEDIREELKEREILKNAIIEAKYANDAKTQFLSTMSHEIRTPMNAIIGMINIAKDMKDINKIYSCLENAEKATNHLLKIINDILDLTKIEAGAISIAEESIDLTELLHRFFSIIVFRSDEKKQKLVIRVDRDIPNFLIGDSMRLIQVLMNLTSNAVKFSSENSKIEINISVKELLAESVILQISVKDQGIGISTEQQKNLFTPFNQADPQISNKYGGTGLGLAITKRIIELMDGTISVDSKPNVGSTFTITASFKIDLEQQSKSYLKPPIFEKSLNVLTIDNEIDDRYSFKIMREWGINVLIASSIEEAIKLIETNNIDLIMIDYYLNKINGIEAAKTILNSIEKKIPITLVTPFDKMILEADANDAGISWVLETPILYYDIVTFFNQFLGNNNIEEIKEEMKFDFSNKRILVVEDIDINRDIVTGLLSSTNVLIDEAENGKMALDLYKIDPNKYDLVLMDIQMPIMNGYEATRQMRKIDGKRNKPIPILAMTANAFKDDIDACINAGFNEHISKPLDPNRLFLLLSKYLK